MLNDAELLKLFLPELLIEHFEIVKFEQENKILHIYFEEKNTAPKEFSSLLLQSKGFVPEITVNDFPLRGKTVNSTSNAEDGPIRKPATSSKEIGISLPKEPA